MNIKLKQAMELAKKREQMDIYELIDEAIKEDYKIESLIIEKTKYNDMYFVRDLGYFYKSNGDGPYCMNCLEGKNKFIHIEVEYEDTYFSKPRKHMRGRCNVCHTTFNCFYEEEAVSDVIKRLKRLEK